MSFDHKEFIKLTQNSQGNLATNRVSENWFHTRGHIDLWGQFIVATKQFEDFTLHQRAKLVHLGGYETRNLCQACGAKPTAWIYHRLSVCCSRACEKSLGITKPIKESTGKKYNESGKRVDPIRKRFVESYGFNSFDEYIAKLKHLIEVDKLSLVEAGEILGPEGGTLSAHCEEFNIQRISDTEAIIRGVQRKYGVDNVMDVPEIRQKQKEKLNEAFDDRYDEIIEARKKTNLERYGTECAMHNPDIQRQIKIDRIERYGYDHRSKIPGLQKEAYQKTLVKFGGKHPVQNFTRRSRGELELQNWIESEFKLSTTPSKRSLLKPTKFEVDIYIKYQATITG